ncbi:MAG: GNAT family N-acetyltransferase, partial [Clostridia bacterium]|nr:GNAT family N-acetyltransferase [Clostridia bacterium]
MKTLELRRATAADIPALARIEEACFPDPWSEGALSSHLASEATLTLVACLDGEAVGALLMGLMPPEGEIYRIATLPSARCRGVGRALLARGEELAQEAGVCRIFLDVRASNEPAKALYATHGYAQTG